MLLTKSVVVRQQLEIKNIRDRGTVFFWERLGSGLGNIFWKGFFSLLKALMLSYIFVVSFFSFLFLM